MLIKMADLERRLETIERIMDNQSLVALSQQVSALERRADQLQGQAETLEYNSEDTADRQRQLYADLDTRIQELERSLQARAGNVLDGGTLLPGQLPVPGGSDRDNYRVAFELLKEERYDMAAAAFIPGGEEPVVAVNNPPGFFAHSQMQAVVIPQGNEQALRKVVDAFGVGWVVLETNHPVGLDALYADPSSVGWLALAQSIQDPSGQPVHIFKVVR